MAYLDVIDIRYTSKHKITTREGFRGKGDYYSTIEQLFPCIGGPFNEMKKAELDAIDYIRYNTSGSRNAPKCVLIHKSLLDI